MKQLRKSEIRELNDKLAWLGIEVSKKANISMEENFYYEKDEIVYFTCHEKLYPCIKQLLKSPTIMERFKTVVVDMGAVRFVVSGADIMRPGITEFDKTLAQGDPVVVLDESHRKPIALGLANYSAEQMKHETGGKAIRTIHYVGDHIWNSDPNS